MKQLILFLLLNSALSIHAQNSEWKIALSHTGVREDALVYTIYKTEKRCKARVVEAGDSTVILIDSVSRQVLVMNEHPATAEVYTIAFDELTEQEAGANLLPDGVDYRLLPEKKTIHGLSCQRIELLYKGVVKGYGWVALGHKLTVLESNFVRPLTAGQLVEFDLETDGLVTHCELLIYESGISYPAGFFPPDLKNIRGLIIKD